jgi:RNA polymerase sigma factor (sigma-70 family)
LPRGVLEGVMAALRETDLDRLSSRYRTPLTRFFERRMRGSADVEDLVQEVFIRLARMNDLNEVQNLDGYVFQVAANLLRDHGRRLAVRGGRDGTVELDDLPEEAGFTPERVLLGKEALQRLVAALYELPEKTRMIFTLYHLESVRQVEIAKRLAMPISTVEKHLGRANAHLLRRVGKLP